MERETREKSAPHDFMNGIVMGAKYLNLQRG
jgi:hypothetical protein